MKSYFLFVLKEKMQLLLIIIYTRLFLILRNDPVQLISRYYS
jgi:hypothetical protein